MKLYEVNNRITELLMTLEPDPETGEVTGDVDSVIAELNSLEMQRSSILEYLAKIVLDTRASVNALKEEERRLHERRQVLERRDERLMEILDRECAGQKTDCGVATVSYRKTTSVDVLDSAKAIRWLKRNKLTDCFRIPEPEVSKSNVKKLLQAGSKVPGITLKENMSCSLR